MHFLKVNTYICLKGKIMYPASLIAAIFVKRGIKEQNYLTQMKLQKMVYFAHGYHLAVYDEPLIIDGFQAWKYGPVAQRIYENYRLYGKDPIKDESWSSFSFSNNDLEDALDEKAKASIEYTWKATKKVSAEALSNWTHEKDSPWSKVYSQYDQNNIISDVELRKYFLTFLNKK